MPARTCTRLLAVAVGLAAVVGVGPASYANSSPVYVVRPGDTLWHIASEDGITVSQLATANGLSPNGILQIGTQLTIPPASAPSSPAAAPATPAAAGVTAAPAVVTTAATTSSGSGFCSTFTPEGGPEGVLPTLLTESPDRLALVPLFDEWAEHYGIPASLVEAIAWQESGWQQDVVSSAQAVGVGQLIPSTAEFVQNDLVGESLDITSVSDNIRMSAAFLAYLDNQEGGNLCQTIAAYYEGPLNLATYGVFAMTEPYVESVEALLPRFE
jgi:murein DD-endopeptidase MepM/ murein hydrolase activator NlpD